MSKTNFGRGSYGHPKLELPSHSLDEVGSAKGGQLGQKRSARIYLRTKCYPQEFSQIIDSRSFP